VSELLHAAGHWLQEFLIAFVAAVLIVGTFILMFAFYVWVVDLILEITGAGK